MKWFKNIFRHKEKQEPQPLRIEGVPPAPLTAEPDDAELAAAAFLEHMCDVRGKREDVEGKRQPSAVNRQASDVHDVKYFRALAERIRQAHDATRLRTMRLVAFCEQELKKADLPLEGPGSLGLLNVELMKRIDTIERVGGDLKRRWQHCLAEVTVRLMQATAHTDSTDNDTNTKNNDIDNRTDHESP